MKLNRILFVLFGATAFIFLQTACSDSQAPVRTLATATSVINGRCPEMVDPETQLDSVVLSTDRNLEYYYTLLYREKRSMNTDALRRFLIPSITENVRTNPALRMHRDSSVIMIFNYMDRNGESVTSISIGPEQYQ